jgi:3-hydroxy-9,10-secoandrosta-1,3,5(10)-triene-9,17-dione monooxygenase reductase component
MNMQTVDPEHFRSVMGAFPTGVAIIATEWESELFGATINSLTSVSLTPCMLLFCTNEGSATGMAIRKRGLFSVNILGHHQSDLSVRFTGKQRNRFEDLAVGFSADGLPLLEGAAAQLCCRVTTIHRAGDHDIILGEVLSGRRRPAIRSSFTKVPTGSFNALSLNSRSKMSSLRSVIHVS